MDESEKNEHLPSDIFVWPCCHPDVVVFVRCCLTSLTMVGCVSAPASPCVSSVRREDPRDAAVMMMLVSSGV